jgi:hypothetical protein
MLWAKTAVVTQTNATVFLRRKPQESKQQETSRVKQQEILPFFRISKRKEMHCMGNVQNVAHCSALLVQTVARKHTGLCYAKDRDTTKIRNPQLLRDK